MSKKHWNLAYCDGIECAVSKDGQLFMFGMKDVGTILIDNYEYAKHEKAFWWNDSHDRYIAEVQGDGTVTVNPQFCYKHFKEIVT
jgi:hypothetical protein